MIEIFFLAEFLFFLSFLNFMLGFSRASEGGVGLDMFFMSNGGGIVSKPGEYSKYCSGQDSRQGISV